MLRTQTIRSAKHLLDRRTYFTKARQGGFATVSPSVIPQSRPPLPPSSSPGSASKGVGNTPPGLPSKTPYLDTRIFEALASQESPQTSLHDIIGHYLDETGNVLGVTLPYESRPGEERRVRFGKDESSKEVITVAHCARDGDERKISFSSGFAVNVRRDSTVGEGAKGGAESEYEEMLIVTCAHTLEEIRQSPLLQLKEFLPSDRHHIPTGTFICTGAGESLKVYPASGIVSALPRSDVVLLSCSLPKGTLNSLPLSPYPAPEGAVIRAHFVSQDRPYESTWQPWIGDTWGDWVQGRIIGYSDFSGGPTKPGMYAALSTMLFTPFPTAGSSGGPIVDEESGAVIGVMLGSMVDSQAAGVRGWGIPAETIFEMFSLPGLEGKK